MEWEGKTRGGTFGYSFFIYIIKIIGVLPAYAFLCFVIPYFILFAPKATRNIWYYARRIHKFNCINSVKLLFSNYYRLGQILIDKVAIGNGLVNKFKFKFENYEGFLDLLNENEGAVIVGAHVGNWEMGVPFFGDYGKKINIVLYDAEYQKIKEILKKNAYGSTYKIIPISDNSFSHVFAIKSAIDEKEYVCFQGDRYLAEEHTLKSEFLGKETLFPRGPFLLASRIKVPVIFYYAMREKGRRYRFYFKQVEHKWSDRMDEDFLLQQYINSFENIVRRYPEQWFNYYPFWKKKKTT